MLNWSGRAGEKLVAEEIGGKGVATKLSAGGREKKVRGAKLRAGNFVPPVLRV